MSAGDWSQPSSMNSTIDLLAEPFDVERAAADEMAQPLEPLRAGRSARRCSGRRPRLPRRPPRCRIRGNGRGRRKARAARRASDSRPPAGSRRRRAGCGRGRRSRRPRRAISSRLWRVTLTTVTPPTRPAPAARPASACRCGRPGCRSPRAWSRPARPGICAPAPSAAPRRRSRAAAAVQPVDLVDHAVDVERQVGARASRSRGNAAAAVEVVAADEQVGDRNAEALDPLHRLELGLAERLAEISPQPWAKKRSGRAAVTPGSFCRSEPAAALRGLAKILAARRLLRAALSAAKSAFDM